MGNSTCNFNWCETSVQIPIPQKLNKWALFYDKIAYFHYTHCYRCSFPLLCIISISYTNIDAILFQSKFLIIFKCRPINGIFGCFYTGNRLVSSATPNIFESTVSCISTYTLEYTFQYNECNIRTIILYDKVKYWPHGTLGKICKLSTCEKHRM